MHSAHFCSTALTHTPLLYCAMMFPVYPGFVPNRFSAVLVFRMRLCLCDQFYHASAHPCYARKALVNLDLPPRKFRPHGNRSAERQQVQHVERD